MSRMSTSNLHQPLSSLVDSHELDAQVSPMIDGGYCSEDDGEFDSLQTPQSASQDLCLDTFHVETGSPEDDFQTFRTSLRSSRHLDSDVTFLDPNESGYSDEHKVHSDTYMHLKDPQRFHHSPVSLDPPVNPFLSETLWRDAESVIVSNMLSLSSDTHIDPFASSFSRQHSRQSLPRTPVDPSFSNQATSCMPLLDVNSWIGTQLSEEPLELPHLASEPAVSRDRPSDTSMNFSPGPVLIYEASAYSPHFPTGHQLCHEFVELFDLQDELGAGGYGLVMTAEERITGEEVAVKFILKSKVPEEAWYDLPEVGRIPLEIVVLSHIDHEGVVKCLGLYQDEHYFYLVQELHGTPWMSAKPRKSKKRLLKVSDMPITPSFSFSHAEPLVVSPSIGSQPSTDTGSTVGLDDLHSPPVFKDPFAPSTSTRPAMIAQLSDSFLEVPASRPKTGRRASYDLFECIEQSKHKRFPEDIACYIFQQVVDTVKYLHDMGIAHRDIKDENLVVDENYKVKLIDFGSAVWVPATDQPRPFYTLFFGTPAYASAEILHKKPYQAEPAEVWTLGVLLSFLLTGASPFLTDGDAMEGRMFFNDPVIGKPYRKRMSSESLDLLGRCLHPDPELRADILEVAEHPWLHVTF